ncbi:MAG: PASTA domain-containing protein, partial [Acidimicrobiales bacterium]
TAVLASPSPGPAADAEDAEGDDVTALAVPLQAQADRTGPVEVADEVVLPAAHRPRRKWPWAALVLVVALLGAGTAYVVAQARIPRYPVPSVRGMTVDEARTEVAEEEFEIRVGRTEFHEEVPDQHIVEQDPSPLRELREGGSITVVVSKGPEPRAVPDLTGLDQAAAEQALRDAGFEPKVDTQPHEEQPPGAVLTWSPTGSALPKGITVTVTVSSGPAPREIPDVTGTTFEEAAAALGEVGLKAERAEVFSADVEKGRVVSTKPPVGKSVPRDSTVVVNISKGPDVVPVPDVLGKSVAEAKALIESAGLQVSGTGGLPRGRTVFLTEPAPGTRIPRNAGVFLFVR